jgi:hypothetical protein
MRIDKAAATRLTVTKVYADSPYTATVNDDLILCNAVDGAITINLPTVSGNSGLTYTVKKIDSSVNAITVDANGSELIDGALTQVISSQWTSMTIASDGSAWYIS